MNNKSTASYVRHTLYRPVLKVTAIIDLLWFKYLKMYPVSLRKKVPFMFVPECSSSSPGYTSDVTGGRVQATIISWAGKKGPFMFVPECYSSSPGTPLTSHPGG